MANEGWYRDGGGAGWRVGGCTRISNDVGKREDHNNDVGILIDMSSVITAFLELCVLASIPEYYFSTLQSVAIADLRTADYALQAVNVLADCSQASISPPESAL